MRPDTFPALRGLIASSVGSILRSAISSGLPSMPTPLARLTNRRRLMPNRKCQLNPPREFGVVLGLRVLIK
jgi:hypothetical protein